MASPLHSALAKHDQSTRNVSATGHLSEMHVVSKTPNDTTATKPATQFALRHAPADGVAALCFSPYAPAAQQTSTRLLAAGWDGSCVLHDVLTDSVLRSWTHDAPSAILDTCFGATDSSAFSAGLDHTVRAVDLATEYAPAIVGTHEAAVRCCRFSSERNVLVSGSWDGFVSLWDVREPPASSAGRFDQRNKVFSLDTQDNKLVVATAGRVINIYDLRNMATTLQRRESPLKLMTRVLRCMPDGEGFAIGSMEGRVALEFFDTSPTSQQRKYGFKCHRRPVDNTTTAVAAATAAGPAVQEEVYPVNALAFHPVYGTFASGGADGTVCVWDGRNRKRLKQYMLPCGVSALSFSSNGQLLAMAASAVYDAPNTRRAAPSTVVIRRVGRNEVRPKDKPV